MNRLIFYIYTTGIYIGNGLIFISTFLSDKIRLMYQGRSATLHNIAQNKEQVKDCVWIHCASLGEFEQGRPLIEAIKSTYPNEKILLSFFSPSGYEIRKHFAQADEVIYLPSDLPENNRKLLEYYKPKAFILVKYEFWWNLIKEVQAQDIPIMLISGIFREKDYFFAKYMKPFRDLLARFDMLFVQDNQSAQVLKHHQIENVVIAGDTRIDRVINQVANTDLPDKIKTFAQDKKVFVYGSVWMSDMNVVTTMVNLFPTYKHIIAPHDIHSKNITQLTSQLSVPFTLYSSEDVLLNVLIIDNIGMLAGLYKVADIVYIGGGFGKGIHNVLEPAVFGVPVFFGPKYQKFNEAVSLVDLEAAFSIQNADEMARKTKQLMANETLRQDISVRIRQYFDQNHGATKKILGHLAQILNYSDERSN